MAALPPPVPPIIPAGSIPGLPTLLGRVLAIRHIASDVAEYAFMALAIEYNDLHSVRDLWRVEDAFQTLNIPQVVAPFRNSRPYFWDYSERYFGHYDTPVQIRQAARRAYLGYAASSHFAPPTPHFAHLGASYGVDPVRLSSIPRDFPSAESVTIEIAFNNDDLSHGAWLFDPFFGRVLPTWVEGVRASFLQQAATIGRTCKVYILLTDQYNGRRGPIQNLAVTEANRDAQYYIYVANELAHNVGRMYRLL